MASTERFRRVDVHAHVLPGFYREEMAKAGHCQDGMPLIPVGCSLRLSYVNDAFIL